MNEPQLEDVRRALEKGTGTRWRSGMVMAGPHCLISPPMTVCYSWAPDIETPDVVWIHASIAHKRRMPTYQEMQLLHRAVFGDRWAYEVFAPAADHVNIHEFARHLWGRLDGTPALPNFGRWGTI